MTDHIDGSQIIHKIRLLDEKSKSLGYKFPVTCRLELAEKVIRKIGRANNKWLKVPSGERNKKTRIPAFLFTEAPNGQLFPEAIFLESIISRDADEALVEVSAYDPEKRDGKIKLKLTTKIFKDCIFHKDAKGRHIMLSKIN